MNFGGKGVLAIWSKPPAAKMVHFRPWHDEEHLPERMALSGFLQARRYRSLDRADAFLTVYGLTEVSALEADDYRAVLAAPSPATLQMMSGSTSLANRKVCRIVHSSGEPLGGLIAVWTSGLLGDGLITGEDRHWIAAVEALERGGVFVAVHLLSSASASDEPLSILMAEASAPAEDIRRSISGCSGASIAGALPELFVLETFVGAPSAAKPG